VAGFVLSVWAVRTNRFFSPVVRIQSDRGHHVIDTGPYRFLRHPGYAGLLLSAACGAAALGSWWSLLPLVPSVFLFVRRTGMEDRFLRADLTGYADYAERVQYRLVPGVW
jgi:protein-S-isoprenylcysteine O-methyltransferase Ste14